MIGLIQRVSQAKVEIAGETVGEIKQGLLVLLGVEKNDNHQTADCLIDKLLHYRVFEDEAGKMNLNIQQVQGELLIVSQFTLAADTQKGLRPSFSNGAPPELANQLYQYVITKCQQTLPVQTGQFGADMQVHLINDGPVTFWLQS